MPDEVPRSRQARAAAEQALVRIVHNYGSRPEFVVLGGLVPELLCSGSTFRHAGTQPFAERSHRTQAAHSSGSFGLCE